jgi:hypothetical protein
MTVMLAVKTMQAIEKMMYADQGAAFRVYQGQVIPHMKDAYRGEDEGFRTHLGASVIGKECGRHIWYGWRWARKPKFSARMLRLFNRGHLEEARFIAMLLAIGVQVFQQDANGNQYRISDVGGHFGGSGDGIGIGIPDLPPGANCLLEFKTHGEKSFLALKKSGVRSAKPEHYTQMVVYMEKMGLHYALYGAVNKNTDEVYFEIVHMNKTHADQYIDRGRTIIMMHKVPDRIGNASPSFFACKYCDDVGICFNGEAMEQNCRTCFFARPQEDGTWICASQDRYAAHPDATKLLSKALQLTSCGKFHTPI